jgi:hypothetical protein
MVVEFNGFTMGVIGKKLPSDTTLNNMKKEELIHLLHIAQHNYETLYWFYNNAVNANMAQLNNKGWIPCSERLPKSEHKYLICDDKGNVYTSTYYNNRWLVTIETDEVLAWQPLPDPYKKEGAE